MNLNLNAFGIGRVTDSGIIFKDLYYSCDTAIKDHWYERARSQGSWDVLIIFNENSLDRVLLIEPHRNQQVVCNIIQQNSVSGEKLERYFRSIQKLKAVHSKYQYKKKKKIYPNADNRRRDM